MTVSSKWVVGLTFISSAIMAIDLATKGYIGYAVTGVALWVTILFVHLELGRYEQ